MESSSDKIRQSSYNYGFRRQDVRIRSLAPARKLSRAQIEQLAERIRSGRLAPGARR